MRKLLPICTLAAVAVLSWTLAGAGRPARAADQPGRMLSHDVYFTLVDRSPEAKRQLVAGCQKFLSRHPGTVWFAAGVRVEEHQREVNDLDFDVALHLVFKDKASHDRYQEAAEHHKFIEEFKDNWKSVRVFDSWLDATSHAEGAEGRAGAKGPQLPDGAASFAGMIRGKVKAKQDGRITVAVEAVTRTWRTNEAENPQSLVGREVRVEARRVEGRPAPLVARFLDDVEPGETVEIDVAHRGGDVLTILELTAEQRERVKR